MSRGEEFYIILFPSLCGLRNAGLLFLDLEVIFGSGVFWDLSSGKPVLSASLLIAVC